MAGKKNPFETPEENPFEKGSSSPFDRTGTSVVRCPVCQNSDPNKLDNHNTPHEILRSCLVCGNKWSCGNVGGLSNLPPRVDTEPPPEEPWDPEPTSQPLDDFRTRGFSPGGDDW